MSQTGSLEENNLNDNQPEDENKKLLGVIYGIGMNVNNIIGVGLYIYIYFKKGISIEIFKD
jgi:hypothetical protein